MGPLHGLPISLKDQFAMKGLETIMGLNFERPFILMNCADCHPGYVAWIGNYANHDSVLVQILYECGAVPFVRTNVPQTLMVRF